MTRLVAIFGPASQGEQQKRVASLTKVPFEQFVYRHDLPSEGDTSSRIRTIMDILTPFDAVVFLLTGNEVEVELARQASQALNGGKGFATLTTDELNLSDDIIAQKIRREVARSGALWK